MTPRSAVDHWDQANGHRQSCRFLWIAWNQEGKVVIHRSLCFSRRDLWEYVWLLNLTLKVKVKILPKPNRTQVILTRATRASLKTRSGGRICPPPYRILPIAQKQRQISTLNFQHFLQRQFEIFSQIFKSRWRLFEEKSFSDIVFHHFGKNGNCLKIDGKYSLKIIRNQKTSKVVQLNVF